LEGKDEFWVKSLSSSRYFEIRPFILFLQARLESTTGFLSSQKIGESTLAISSICGIFWPSLGHLGRQHHVLASVWPTKRHFLEIEEGMHLYRTP